MDQNQQDQARTLLATRLTPMNEPFIEQDYDRVVTIAADIFVRLTKNGHYGPKSMPMNAVTAIACADDFLQIAKLYRLIRVTHDTPNDT